MTETVIGGTGPDLRTQAQHEADALWLKRRYAFQAFCNENMNDSAKPMMEFMDAGNYSIEEATDSMSFRIGNSGITNFLRDKGAPDGWRGLKVYTEEQIRAYMDWQWAQPAFYGTGTWGGGKPIDYTNVRSRHGAYEVLDRIERIFKMRADQRLATDRTLWAPWEGDWKKAMAKAAADQAAYDANLMAQPRGNTVIGPN